MSKAANEAVASPSVTLIRTRGNVPRSPAPGLPESRPVDALKPAQPGRFSMSKVSASPSGSDALGRKA
jgi:hypothetical protein